MQKQLYFDNHATTPVDPRVLEVMLPYFKEFFGNAASKQHSFGWSADRGVEEARKQVAQLIGATPQEITFTAGGTESDNMAIVGVFEAFEPEGVHVISTATEHKAILESLKYIQSRGAEITILPVDKTGKISAEQIENAITDKTRMISVIFANNEVGTVNNMQVIGEIAKKNDILFHTDAVQAAGRLPIDVQKLNIDLLSLSSHKIYGPKGVGALFMKRKQPRIRLTPLMRGGGQEKGVRSGTLNVPGIVGFGEACRIAKEEMSLEVSKLSAWRDLMIAELRKIPHSQINGDLQNRLCNNISITVKGVPANRIIMALPELAISTGSACSTQSVEPSYVLKAIGLSDDAAVSTVRFGLGRFTTENEVKSAIEIFTSAIDKLRQKKVD